MNDLNLAAKVKVSSGEHPIWVGWDILDTIGEKINEFVETPIAYIIADQNVQKYVRKIQTSLESVSIKAHVFIIPPGEESKNLNTVRSIYDWLASMNAERKHLVIALGGGAFINKNIRNNLLKNSFSIWLDIDLALLNKRIKWNFKRPLLDKKNNKKKINKLYNERKNIYKMANCKIICNNLTKENIAKKIIKLYEKQ